MSSDSFREYASATRTVERFVLDDAGDHLFSLRELRELVAATTDYDEDAFVIALRARERDDGGLGYWIDGLLVEEISSQSSRGQLNADQVPAGGAQP